METLQFLQLVLPSPGHGLYCAYELKNKKALFFETIEELLAQTTTWAAEKRDVYFALATFEEPSRKAVNARYMRALFADLDAGEGKPYADWRAAATAVVEFVERVGLPLPVFVRSGGGVHVYWPFVEAIPVPEWKVLAESFKALCEQEGLKIDPGVTADSARILRVPGTHNYKTDTPRPVKVLAGEAGEFSPVELGAIIRSKATNVIPFPGTTLQLEGDRPAETGSAVQMFVEDPNRVTRFATLRERSLAGDGCNQLKEYFDHPDGAWEPRWRGFITWAKVCVDGLQEAREFTELHKRPDSEFTSKWNAANGPVGCKIMEREAPKVCKDCKYYGKFTNPLGLARETQLETQATVVEFKDEEQQATPMLQSYERPKPPYGFAFGKMPGTGTYAIKKSDNDDEPDKHIPMLPYELFVVKTVEQTDGHQIVMGVKKRNEVVRQFLIPVEAMATPDATLKSLFRANVVPNSKATKELLYQYVLAATAVSSQHRADRIPEHYGWQDDGSFAFAGHVFRAGQEPLRLPPTKGLENVTKSMTVNGTIEQWRDAVNIFLAKKMWKPLALFVAGMAAPLMRFTEFAGMTVHAYSKQSGTCKTLSLDLIASVWGSYRHYKTPKSTSPLAMQQRLGLLHNLPFLVDEITENARRDPEWVPNHLLSMTEGKGKDRMESSTNSERVNTTTWSTVAVMTSNTPVMQFLRTNRNHSTEGELMRLVEITMDEKPHWSPGEKEAISHALEASGVVGWHYAQFLVDKGETELKALVKRSLNKVSDHFKMNDDERYWTALFGAAYATIVALRTAGIVDLPAGPILQVYDEAFKHMRVTAASCRSTAEEILEAYILLHYSKMITFTSENNLSHFTDGRTVSDITGRVDIDTAWTTFYLPKSQLVGHCSSYSYDYEALKRELTQHMDSGVCEGERKVTFLAGTKAKAGARTWALKVKMRNEAVPVELPAPEAAAGAS